jgi:alpha-ribazole phosphatase/probable phosphoglycerate mutase
VIALRLYLLRHGEVAQAEGGRWIFYGHHDLPLSERGREQARDQAKRLENVVLSGIYCSDLQRTRYTAELLSAARGGKPEVVELPALREMHLGVLEGVERDEARARYPEIAGRSYEDMLDFRVPGGGESVRDVAERSIACLEELVSKHVAASPRGEDPPDDRPPTIAVVAHNTINRVVLARAAGVGPEAYGRFRQMAGAMNRIEIRPWKEGESPWDRAVVVYANLYPSPLRTG